MLPELLVVLNAGNVVLKATIKLIVGDHGVSLDPNKMIHKTYKAGRTRETIHHQERSIKTFSPGLWLVWSANV